MELDKVAHFLVGALIVALLGYFIPLWVAFVAAVIVGAAKELYDSANPESHTPDRFDFLATALGGLSVAVFLLMVKG